MNWYYAVSMLVLMFDISQLHVETTSSSSKDNSITKCFHTSKSSEKEIPECVDIVRYPKFKIIPSDGDFREFSFLSKNKR